MTTPTIVTIVKLIAVYARVSKVVDEESTIENQLMMCEEFAAKNNYKIVKVYTDEDWTGDVLQRPALDTLRQEAKSNLWDAVLIYDPDRLARRYSFQELVMDELKEAGKEVMFITVSAPKNSEEKILHGVRGLFAEYEREKIKERFRIGRIRKVKEGCLLNSKPLFGYTLIPTEKKVYRHYIINEEEAKIVRLIFNLSADGFSIRKIIGRLHELGLKPRNSIRGVWSQSPISRLLRHRGYIGEAHYGSTYSVEPKNPTPQKYRKYKKTAKKKRPREEWYIIPIPPIIDVELFNRVQEQTKSNSVFCQRNSKREYLLSGKIYCGCGCKRFGETNNPRYINKTLYRCGSKLISYPLRQTCEERKAISGNWIDNHVWEKVKELMTSPKLLQEQLNRWHSQKKEKIRRPVSDVKELQKNITKLETEQDRYAQAYGEGLLTIQKFKEYTEAVKRKTLAIQDEIIKSQEASEKLNTAFFSKDALKQFTQKVQKIFNDPTFELKRAIILTVIEKAVATTKSIQVWGHIPIDKMETMISNYNKKTSEPVPAYAGENTIFSSNQYFRGNSNQNISLLSSIDGSNGNSIRHVKIPFQFTITMDT
jgi:site-specific DNA recombinase